MSNGKDILNHIAIPLGFEEDVQWFYKDFSGFTVLYRFVIDQETACLIFGSDLNQ
jgi:hypothetical protein